MTNKRQSFGGSIERSGRASESGIWKSGYGFCSCLPHLSLGFGHLLKLSLRATWATEADSTRCHLDVAQRPGQCPDGVHR